MENDLTIARLDKLARDEDLQAKLSGAGLPLGSRGVRRSAQALRHVFGGEVRYTKRHRLGQLLSGLTRHFLLMTATPHNGKDEDFQLVLALLDAIASRTGSGRRPPGRWSDLCAGW